MSDVFYPALPVLESANGDAEGQNVIDVTNLHVDMLADIVENRDSSFCQIVFQDLFCSRNGNIQCGCTMTWRHGDYTLLVVPFRWHSSNGFKAC